MGGVSPRRFGVRGDDLGKIWMQAGNLKIPPSSYRLDVMILSSEGLEIPYPFGGFPIESVQSPLPNGLGGRSG